jgi:HK97 family phage major capsid protein
MADTIQIMREKREERARLVKQAQALLTENEGALDGDVEKKFDTLMGESDTLKAQIDKMENLAQAEADLEAKIEMKAGREDIVKAGISKDQVTEQMFDESKVFAAWMRSGMDGLSAKSREVMGRLQTKTGQNDSGIYAAQSVGTTTAGGFTVPQDSRFMSLVESSLVEFGGMRQASTIVRTDNAQAMPIPTDNDSAQTGELVAENGATAAQDITFGQVVLDGWMYSSKRVLSSIQLLQDTAVDIEAFIARKLGERIARIQNTHFTTGTGSSQPDGVVTAAALGRTGATGSTTDVKYVDLVELEHSVDPGYRRSSGARWMLNDASLSVIKQIVDGNSRPLFMPGLAVGTPDTILGYPYVVNNDIATMAANAKSILFGDFSKYWIRDVNGFTLLRLTELYAANLQVGFLGFMRSDGDLLDAGIKPIKWYANSAT